MESSPDQVNAQYTCERCGRRAYKGWVFGFKRSVTAEAEAGVEMLKCILCALRHRPLVRRSLSVAVVVGTILTLLNQGDTLLAGSWSNDLYWKISVTYCVPFCVATYGAVSNARR